ncbi:hypothetical protein Q1695_014384 [Nippostrongylus brasiliensis]|nr:hypothetical protein Q1695_014384 [Nippostrongylus brasiliensis]
MSEPLPTQTISTPRSSSAPPRKKRNVDLFLSPDKDSTLDNLFVDLPTSGLPPYMKTILTILLDTREQVKSLNALCSKISQENSALKAENSKLRRLLELRDVSTPAPMDLVAESQYVSVPPSSSSPPVTHSDEQELERLRSFVLSGVPESPSSFCIERSVHDLKLVNAILDHLNVESLPCTSYRMGRFVAGKSRLIKVVLPSPKFQQLAVSRAPRLRSFHIPGIFLRPSLPKLVRDRLRIERQAKKSSSAITLTPRNVSPSSISAPNTTVLADPTSQGNL